MAEFDPQAYIEANTGATSSFDPNAYIQQNTSQTAASEFDPSAYIQAAESEGLTVPKAPEVPEGSTFETRSALENAKSLEAKQEDLKNAETFADENINLFFDQAKAYRDKKSSGPGGTDPFGRPLPVNLSKPIGYDKRPGSQSKVDVEYDSNVKIQEKSESKATFHGNEDSEDDANRKFWENYKKAGITDEDVTKSLLSLKLHLDEINEKLTHHTYILGNELTLPDIAWFIYVSRLKAARYPIHILHPNVNDWFESLLKKEVFATETKTPRIVRFISYIFYVVQKYSGWSIKRQLVG